MRLPRISSPRRPGLDGARESPSATSRPGLAQVRDRIAREAGVVLFALLVALVVGGVLMILTNSETRDAWGHLFQSPVDALSLSWSLVWQSYAALFQGSLGSVYAISQTLTNAAPLLLTGLSVTIAFRAGLFNIGVQGQFLAGAVAAAFVGFNLSGLPVPVHIVLAVAAALLGGGLAALLPAALKVKTGAHEVITTLMMNYVMYYFVTWLIATPAFKQPGQGDPISKGLNVGYPRILGSANALHVGALVALFAAVASTYGFRRTTWGFKVDVVGSNRSAARYAGINVNATYVWVFCVAGALAGLAGAGEVLGVQHNVFPDVAGNFTLSSIAVALLGRIDPLGVVFASILFGGLGAGAVNMQTQTGVPVDIIEVVQALVIILIAAPRFLREVFHIRADEVVEAGALSKGWAQ
jgi:general nucleoside transport system permease protein